MRKRIIAVLMVMMVALSGCGTKGRQSEIKDETTQAAKHTVTSADANSGKNKELVMYKKKDIIDKIKDAHVGIRMYVMMSRYVTITDLKKILPVDNVRKIGKDKVIIEYPMEDCTFIVAAVKSEERIIGTCVRGNKLRREAEMRQIKKGMTLEKVRGILPEAVINTRLPAILDKNQTNNESPYCELMLDNNKIIWISFEKNNGEYVVSDIDIDKNLLFEDKEWNKVLQKEPYSIKNQAEKKEEYVKINEELVLRDGKIVNGKRAWNDFLHKTQNFPNEQAQITIKEYYDGENIGGVLKYDGYNYSLIYKPVKDANAQSETFSELTKSSISKYKYLIERSGKMPNAKYTEHGFYLVNDKSLTYVQLMWSRLSSNSNDWIDFRTVFTEMTES